MAVTISGVKDLVAWADSKSCGPWKIDRSCGHSACMQDQRAVDVLSVLKETSPGVWTLRESEIQFST